MYLSKGNRLHVREQEESAVGGLGPCYVLAAYGIAPVEEVTNEKQVRSSLASKRSCISCHSDLLYGHSCLPRSPSQSHRIPATSHATRSRSYVYFLGPHTEVLRLSKTRFLTKST